MNLFLAFLLLCPGVRTDSSAIVVVDDVWGEFDNAVSLSLAPNAVAYVADQQSSKIFSIAFQEHRIQSFGGNGWGDYTFDAPIDVAATFLLELYVVDRNNRRIQQYDRTMNFVQTYDEHLDDRTEGKFAPRAVAVSRLGNIFIAETDGHRIIKLNARKQIEKIFGTLSDGKGRLQSPLDLCISDDNKVFVLDDQTVKVFDDFGNYMYAIPLQKNVEWKSISKYLNGFLVTSPQQLTFYSGDFNVVYNIQKENIIGLTDESTFTDAVFADSTLFVLTSHHLYRCSFPR